MATDERKASLEFGVDSAGVKPGLDSIKTQVRDMAADVEQSGQRAAKGISSIGDGAPAATQKLESNARSWVRTVERVTSAAEAGEKGTAKFYETLGGRRGLSGDFMKPYLEDLRKVEVAQKVASGSLGSMEMSAKATAAAMRGVPAQFTDIITSLQGGQAPLTVFLQQGGQLKDMFGGAGAAARALGGYVVGLINPFTAAAAVAGTLAVAYNQGSKEADGYRNALILTGNSAGTTSAQLKSYAQDISGVVGTQGKAAESLTALAASGKVSADVLRDAGLAAVQYERATGQAVSKTAEQFASLRNEPLSGVLKLNEGMNFLTESTYRQIKSLEEQGRTADAARVAQEAYANALTGRSSEIERNLGSIERGWIKIKDAAKSGWDAILNVGRQQTTGDQLADVRKQIAEREALLSRAGWGSTGGGAATGGMNTARNARAAAELEGLRAQEAALQGVAHASSVAAQAEADRAKNSKAYFEWDKQADAFRSKSDKRKEEVAKAEAEGRSLIAAGLIKEADLRERIAAINKKYEEKGSTAGQSEIAGIRAKIVAEQEYIDRLRERGSAAEKLTEGERLTLKIQDELKGKLDAKTRALKEQELVEAKNLATLNKVRIVDEQRVKSIADSEAAYRKFLDSIVKAGDAIGEQAAKQEAANTAFGKGKTAIEEMVLAQQKLALANERDSGPWDPARIAAMEVAISQQERYVRALQAGDIKVVNQHTDELLANAREQAKLYEDETRLIGLSALERAKVVALRQVELKYAKELSRIKEMPEGTAAQIAAKEEQRLKVLEAKQIESQAAVSKVIEEDWNKTSQLIGDTLADYIMGGGKDAAQYLKRLFATLVLQPQVQMLVGGLLGGGIAGAAGGVSGMVSGAGSIVSLGQNIYNAITGGFSSLGNSIAMYTQQGLNWLTGSGAMGASSLPGSFAQSIGGFGSAAAGIGGGILGGRLISGGYSLGGGSGNGVVNFGTGAGAIVGSLVPGIGTALGSLVGGLLGGTINRLFGRKLKDSGIEGEFGGETGFEGNTYQYYKGGLFRSSKTVRGELDEELRKALADQFTYLKTGTEAMAETLGLGTAAIDDFTASLKISFQGLSEEEIQAKLEEELAKIGESLASLALGTDEFNRSGETAAEALTRLSGSLVAVNGVFDNLGETLYATSLAGADMASQLVDLFGGADAFGSATGSYFQNFYSADEQRAAMQRQLEKQLGTLNLKLPDINADDARAQYRALAESMDLTTEEGRKAWAMLIQLSDAFAGITAQAEDATVAAAAAAAAEIERQKKVADQRFAIEQRLLIAQGKDRQALDLRRGQEYEALAKLDPALAKMISQVWELEDAAQAVADREAARSKAMRDLSDAMGRQTEIWEAQLAAIDAQRQLQQESLSLITGIFDLVRSNARDLYGEVQSTAAMQATQGSAFIAQALATAKRTGYLPEQDALQQAISGARSGLDSNNFASQVDADFARLVLAGQLKGLEEIAGPQKTAAEKQIERLDAQTDALNKQIREQQKQYDLIQRQIDIENGTYNATITVAEATAKIIELLGGKAPAGVGSGAVDNSGAAWGGSAAGTGTSAATSKYRRMFSIGGSDVGYEAITDTSMIDRLDKLFDVYHSFDGTGDLWGLGTAFKAAGGTIADLAIMSGHWEREWRDAFATVGLPSFAVGTNYVPQNMVAQIHQGERIIPAADNRALMAAVNGGGSSSDMAAVLAELRAVKAELAAVRASTESTAGSAGQLADQTDSVTEGGNANRVEIMNVSALAKAIAEEMAA